jgi:SAM-dependent methyltransferase
MLRFSLKKRQKLELLERMLQALPIGDARCLLVTNGDNTGALNFRFRQLGGRWRWAELEAKGIADMEAFLGEPVDAAQPNALPFDDMSFERIVVIDVHEHLHDTTIFNKEISRVLAPGGLAIITTPNGDQRLPVAVLKRWIGMREEAYGHVVQGYRADELENMLRGVGLTPAGRGAYARFFTELVELAINFGYTKVLATRNNGQHPNAGDIAPRTAGQLSAVGRSYRIYRALFPLIRMFASLDRLVPGRGGYAVAIAARKPAA